MTPRPQRLGTLALAVISLPIPADALSIRHDRAESRYVELAAGFPAVGSVSELGTATLIAPRWALSAAHVTELIGQLLPDAPLTLALGDSLYVVERVVYPAGRETITPGRGGREDHTNARDIALLRLDRAVEHVTPLDLYRDTDEVGRDAVLVGCGALMADGASGSEPTPALMALPRGTRRAGSNRIERVEPETGVLVASFDLPESALDLEAAPFVGDSGGPALVRVGDRWHVASVISEIDTGNDEILGNYGDSIALTRVSSHLEWIGTTIR